MNQIQQAKKDWDDLAELDATWFNVPSHKWEIEEFFAGGKPYVEQSLKLIEKHQISIPRNTALDFGCGIGRVTQALATEFDLVYGVDISEKMIEVARKHNKQGEKCKFIANPAPDLSLFQDASLNFIFSNNALQHNHPDIIRNYLLEFVRILVPPGVMVFQIPIERLTHEEKVNQLRSLPKFHPKRIWNKLRGILIGHDIETRYYRLRKLGFSKKWLYDNFGLRPRINMYHLEENKLRDLLESQGCVIKDVERYQYEDMIHARFLVLKNG